MRTGNENGELRMGKWEWENRRGKIGMGKEDQKMGKRKWKTGSGKM